MSGLQRLLTPPALPVKVLFLYHNLSTRSGNSADLRVDHLNTHKVDHPYILPPRHL